MGWISGISKPKRGVEDTKEGTFSTKNAVLPDEDMLLLCGGLSTEQTEG